MNVKKNANRLFILIFLVYIISVPILNYITKDKEVSALENRTLATVPVKDSTYSQYFKDIQTYINDQFIFRERSIEDYYIFNFALGRNIQNNVTKQKIGNETYLFNTITRDISTHDKLIDDMQQFKLISDSMDIPYYYFVIPRKTDVWRDSIPVYAQDNFIELKEEMFNILDEKDITYYDLLPLYTKSKEDGNTDYYLTDHHYNINGAFKTYQYITETLGIDATTIQDYDIINVENSFAGSRARNIAYGYRLNQSRDDFSYMLFKGDSSFKISRNNSEYETIEFQDYINLDYINVDEPYVNNYGAFMNGDTGIIDIVNNNIENGKTMIMFKNSFANAVIPFLSLHFERIVVIDSRFYEGDYTTLANDIEPDIIVSIVN